MKKYTLALLVSAVTLPLAAQAAPEFYGKFHVSVDKASDYLGGDFLDGALSAPNAGLSDGWAAESNNSRIGVRGSEPLFNNDLKAIYQFEAGADLDGDNATVSTRNSFLGLGTKVGDFFIGRYDSVVKQAEGNIDQFNDTDADMKNVFFSQNRTNSSLNWVSPTYGALVFKVQMAPGENTVVDGETKDGLADVFGASATFKQDNFFAALAFEKGFATVTVVNPAAPPPTIDLGVETQFIRASAGVSLDGGIELGGIIETVNFDAGGDVDGVSMLLSGKLQANERLALKAQIGRFDSSDLDVDATVITGGADYAMGKQTKVYGLLSISDLNAGAFDEGGNLISAGMIHSF
ncbi:MAG: porin [Alcanivoracaceae bacterium]|nr:porin [Alcanivoracaceae bacterium]